MSIELDELDTVVQDTVARLYHRYHIQLRTKPLVSSCVVKNLRKSIREINHLDPETILPRARSVIVVAVPHSVDAILRNAREKEIALSYAREYVLLNKVLKQLLHILSNYLRARGYEAAVPEVTLHGTVHSNWSHRYIAYLAGLGTLGKHRLIITKIGCSVRLGTLVTTARVRPSGEPIKEEYCLAKRGIECSACIERCPLNALKNWEKGGREKCFRMLQEVSRTYKKLLKVEEEVDCCGKCMSNLVCSFKPP
ncbi:MAG: epoxyqueuosine reductase [Thermoprotei archaeon]|nr:MAG: epoxyqueuosine reductase [Thermoprotei archaeon]